MGTARARHQVHIDWLRLIEVSGPFLSVPVLAAEWPDLESLGAEQRDRLSRAHRQWLADPVAGKADWIEYVLEDLLGWPDTMSLADDLSSLALEVPQHEVVITPTFALREPGSDGIRLLGIVSDESPIARIKGSGWPATPADRLAQLCRARGVELGLATDGRWWALVWAPAGGVTTVASFDSISWSDASERIVVRAFVSLLQRRRFFAVPPPRQLPALLRESLNNQEELTDRLGVQVRQAVELLVAAFGRTSVSAETSASEIYRGAVTMMMRLVFLFFAEATSLLPADNDLYISSYSVAGLYMELERQVTDALGNEAELDHTYVAWHRLLALCTAIDRGITHPDLQLIAHDGSLFEPARHPWFPLSVDDRTVLHILRSVQTVTIGGERRTVSFRTMSVEQIGYVYEGLLSFEGFRASEVVVGLIGKEGREEEVALTELEALGHADLPQQLAEKYKTSGIGSARALTAKLVPLTRDEKTRAETKLYAVTKDHVLVQRLLPFYGVIRKDLRGDPVVILPGQIYVTESTLRASTGAHYTPRHLAEQVAEGALEPLIYNPGPLQTADRSRWKLLKDEEILKLRVADIAMGSGAFLVAACRYLADKLIEAWSKEGNVDALRSASASTTGSGLDLDIATDPLVIEARRLVIENCLYGVDINEMAVEMAKLSLWLVSMDSSRPFTFLDDRLAVGDSLLGVTSVEQLEWMHLDVAAGQELHEHTLLDFVSGVRNVLRDATEQRRVLVGIPTDNIGAVRKKREILAQVRSKTKDLSLYADLISGAALTKGRWLQAAKLANDAATASAVTAAEEQAKRWLATDQPDGAFDRDPLHWPLLFPEVFDSAAPGFDAIIGNPPFLGGQKLTGSLGTAYREYLVNQIGGGIRGSADEIAYFLLRAHSLVNQSGQTGLIATNTLAQGDTREVGLDQIVASGTEIRQAIKSKPWPAKSAVLEYAAVWTSRRQLDPTAQREADGIVVSRIAPSLDSASRVSGNPKRLAANAGLSFQGAIVLGLGFTMDPGRAREMIARDPRNKDVLFPYLNGQDLNSRPDCSGSRWVINFHDWPLEKARTYTEPYIQILREVKPERDTNNRKAYRDYWWQYAEKRPALVAAVAGLNRVLTVPRVTKYFSFVLTSRRQVFDGRLVVFASEDPSLLCILSSSMHETWALAYGTTHEARPTYFPERCFETFPLPEITTATRELGVRLDSFRRDLMRARQAGLTATYNLMHDPKCTDADIAELRDIHRAIDVAVVRAYGWTDLLNAGLDHRFHDTRQGFRHTIGPTVRQEILDRLLELNHARHAAEVQSGMHDVTRRKNQSTKTDDDAALFLFGRPFCRPHFRRESMRRQTAVEGFASGGSLRRFARNTASGIPAWKSLNRSAVLSQVGSNFFRCLPACVALLKLGQRSDRCRMSQTSKQGTDSVSSTSDSRAFARADLTSNSSVSQTAQASSYSLSSRITAAQDTASAGVPFSNLTRTFPAETHSSFRTASK